MSPQMGRPKSDNPKTDRIYIRVAPDEKRAIQDFSSKSGYSILGIIREGIEAIKSKKK